VEATSVYAACSPPRALVRRHRLVPLSIAQNLFRLALGARLPTTQGTLRVPALRAPVTIRRDAYGIPYIEATCDDDAWYALGFCQGQDRAFQIESLIRAVRGTLAEVAGPDVLPVDRLARRIGFRRIGEAELPFITDAARRQIEAFCLGTRDGIALGCPKKPHEHTLLGIEP